MTDETLLLRQVNPSFMQGERPSSQVFKPTPKDEELLSVYDGDQIEPEAAWQHFTGGGFPSFGVLAVTVGECSSIELLTRPDPEPFPEHAVVDFSGLSRGKIEKCAKQLRANAVARGWLFQQAS